MCLIIFSYMVRNDTAKKKKANKKKTEIFLLFTLLTLYPHMPSERFRRLRANFCQLIQTGKVEHWMRVSLSYTWGGLLCSFIHIQLYFLLI